MRNPFTLMANGFNGLFGKTRDKIEAEQAKAKDTKKETGRSGGGGGGDSASSEGVTLDKVFAYENFKKAVKKRRVKNKTARKSRRINRLRKAS